MFGFTASAQSINADSYYIYSNSSTKIDYSEVRTLEELLSSDSRTANITVSQERATIIPKKHKTYQLEITKKTELSPNIDFEEIIEI